MRYHSILRTLLAGSALVALSSAAVAQEETKLDLITVIIGKVKQSLQDAVGGVSVATRKDLEQHGSSSVSDVLAPMPGVSTEENANDPAPGGERPRPPGFRPCGRHHRWRAPELPAHRP